MYFLGEFEVCFIKMHQAGSHTI